MSDDTEGTTGGENAGAGAGQQGQSDTDVTDWQAEAGKWKELARKHEGRAKENVGAAKELAKVREAAMSEQEKAVAEAEKRGAQEASTKVGARLVRAEFRAAAAGQVDKDTLDAYLEDVDPAKFLGDDGEPDTKAIEARIKRLGGGRSADFDGGARASAAKPTDMNQIIRRAAGLG